jgi:hypothetical protein
MIYLFDTNALGVLKNFYPDTFPQFWEDFELAVAAGEILSVEEVRNESAQRIDSLHITAWIEANKGLFGGPTEDEMAMVAEIFAVPHFQQLVSQDVLLRGGYVADPWLIARARGLGGTVVTEEKMRPQAAKIPNVCEHFRVPWCSVQGFLKAKGWKY